MGGGRRGGSWWVQTPSCRQLDPVFGREDRDLIRAALVIDACTIFGACDPAADDRTPDSLLLKQQSSLG